MTAVAPAPSDTRPPSGPSQGSGVFWKASTQDEQYWDDYIAARPKYTGDFYDRIIEYYKTHNPSPSEQSIAHDVGTGPGQVAAELCKHFDKVVASDTNATHTDVAAIRNEASGLNKKIAWVDVAAEDLGSHYPAQSTALVTAAECLPLLDVSRAMNAFAHLLKQDGTLAVWFYGRPCFSDPATAAKCQPVLNQIIDLTFENIIKSADGPSKANWKRSTDTLYSFLDNVPFPATTWRDVHRYKWNSHLPLSVVGPNACNYTIETESRIDPTRETVIEENDPSFWQESWNIKELRRFVEALLPNIDQLKAQGLLAHVEPKYKELESCMGGPSEKKSISWPVVLILATRV